MEVIAGAGGGTSTERAYKYIVCGVVSRDGMLYSRASL